jgi:tryptophan synthase alpha chain
MSKPQKAVQPEQGSRITQCFDLLRLRGRKALIPFITAGDPEPEITVPLMYSLVKAGADIIELGVPFSDPMADGPVIQRASERALKHRVSLREVLSMVHEFRTQNTHTPVVLMGYLNPIEVMGYTSFARAAAQAGVDGVLTVDMPPEEANDLADALQAYYIAPIFLLAPTSSAERIRRISAVAHGFIYYVSIRGVTGAANMDIDEVKNKLTRIRTLTKLPLGVGFGIKDATSAARVATLADAVIVGSALVQKIEALADKGITSTDKVIADVAGLLAEMRHAMDQPSIK